MLVSVWAVDVLVLVNLSYVCLKPDAPSLLVGLVRAPLWVEGSFLVHVRLVDQDDSSALLLHVLFASGRGCLVHPEASAVDVPEAHYLLNLSLYCENCSRCNLE